MALLESAEAEKEHSFYSDRLSIVACPNMLDAVAFYGANSSRLS